MEGCGSSVEGQSKAVVGQSKASGRAWKVGGRSWKAMGARLPEKPGYSTAACAFRSNSKQSGVQYGSLRKRALSAATAPNAVGGCAEAGGDGAAVRTEETSEVTPRAMGGADGGWKGKSQQQ